MQNLDIAPTVLDYLGLNIPAWMQGQSILDEPLEQRNIFGVHVSFAEETEDGTWKINADKLEPPFYQFGKLSLIHCQKWYLLLLTIPGWSSGEVEGYASPCPEGDLLSDAQAQQLLLDHLRLNGFDTTALDEYFRQNP